MHHAAQPVKRAIVMFAALVLLVGPRAAAGNCDRVIAVADLHGGYDAFIDILHRTELIDDELKWIDDETCFVQTGDVVDRGPDSRRILDLMIDLKEQQPDRVFMLLGNHEIMNMIGDLRYVHPGEFAVFADEEDPLDRQRGLSAFGKINEEFGLEDERLREVFDATFPRGWFAHRKAFSPQGRYGAWLLQRAALKIVNATLFVHGGISASDAHVGIEKLNQTLRRELLEFHELRTALVKAGWLNPLLPYKSSGQAVAEALTPHGEAAGTAQNGIVGRAREYLSWIQGATYARLDGPLWIRELAIADEDEYAATLEETLVALGIKRVVIGHTPTDSSLVERRFDGQVYAIDSGAGPAYGGNISALEIGPYGSVRAIYLWGVDVLAEPSMTDEQIEDFMKTAEVVSAKEIGSGISKPLRLELARNGFEMSVAFKNIDIYKPGLTKFESGRVMNFSDSYKYDRVAYLLDRELRLNMVPVTAVREYEGQIGAVVQWIEDAIDETKRRRQELKPDDPAVLVRSRALMTLFDALIANDDRNLGNQLYTPDWKLHLIDHSRAFRLNKALSKGFMKTPISLPRELLPRLEALEVKALIKRFEGLVSKAQIKALLARRDKILGKIESDRAEYGDELVFLD